MASITSHAIISNEGIAALRSQSDEISREVTTAYFEAHPECKNGDIDRIKAMCKSDFQYHLDFLLTSLSTGTQTIFYDYTLWLKGVLENRSLSIRHPIESFSFMKDSISKRLNGGDIAVSAETLDRAIAILKQNASVEASQLEATYIDDGNKQFTNALIIGDKKNAEAIASKSLNGGVALVDLEVGIVQPAMYEIGRLWAKNKITVAQEHLATAIAQNVLARAFLQAEFEDPIDKHVMCACIEGNHHGLGLRMVSDAFETSGWDVCFLGTNTPNQSIITQLDKTRPDLLALSVSMPHQVFALRQLIEIVRANMAGKSPSIIIGGLAINHHHELNQKLAIDNWYQDAKAVWKDINPC